MNAKTQKMITVVRTVALKVPETSDEQLHSIIVKFTMPILAVGIAVGFFSGVAITGLVMVLK